MNQSDYRPYDLEDTLLHVRTRLKALSYFFQEASCDSSFNAETAAGVSHMIDDVLALLEPLESMPVPMLNWRPDRSEEHSSTIGETK